eukprot:7123026-Alexandrium_andersonii.AAC.2
MPPKKKAAAADLDELLAPACAKTEGEKRAAAAAAARLALAEADKARQLLIEVTAEKVEATEKCKTWALLRYRIAFAWGGTRCAPQALINIACGLRITDYTRVAHGLRIARRLRITDCVEAAANGLLWVAD